ncbi:hypothetical protein X753_21305 [Mesorhizobium sp. LNJC399B00]|uniref:hypothetical protein n=1 Tax=Mesorhizobium sp. LNJC399B00 TaxID=1287277 RepID=UPI0003CF87A1|nr:hypothetical protein [Mesorhizobium sp. LNJC399B00]ESY03892.1 hypothetical protein X753_21305 [Mesorhizobium sp. LNJC399B00]
MLFADMQDAHDRRVEKLIARMDNPGDQDASILADELRTVPLVSNFNLVGIRRRLNNIEVGVWAIVGLLVLHIYRHW